MFRTISEIKLEDKSTWENKRFVTFDIEWASDEVWIYLLDILEKYQVKTTMFVTHDTPLLEQIRKNKNIELGIHPNFNFLVQGDFRYGKNLGEVVDYYMNIVPEAISVRSHDLMFQSQLLRMFSEKGLKYECNLFLPDFQDDLKPFLHYDDKLIRVPHFWEDDIYVLGKENAEPKSLMTNQGIKVFDFHPIHVFLNTENMDRYFKCKQFYHEAAKLEEVRNTEVYGTYDFLIDLLEQNV